MNGLDKILYDIVTNSTMRESVMRLYRGEQRNLDVSCNWPEVITPWDYMRMYERNPIAGRIIDLFPNECWAQYPQIYEGESPSTESEFEKVWTDLPKQLTSDDVNYHENDGSGNALYEVMHRLDKCCGIGAYGVLLLGIADENQRDLSLPVSGVEESGSQPRQERWDRVDNKGYRLTLNKKSKLNRLSYLIPLPQVYAEVSSWESNPYSPRYGKPTQYRVTLNQGGSSDYTRAPGINTISNVHWTRIVHIADNVLGDPIEGIPRLKPIYNNLLDVAKLLGGSAEMYWQGALPGITLETHPQVGGDVDINKDALNDEVSKFVGSLSRWLILKGMSARTLSPVVVDPSGQLAAQYEAISTRLSIPKRMLIGSERGELASSQDERQWRARVAGRNQTWTIPSLVCKVVNRLIMLNVLPIPKTGGYKVEWSQDLGMTEKERMEVAALKTNVLANYVSAGVENVMPLNFFFEEVMGFDTDMTKRLLKELKKKDTPLTAPSPYSPPTTTPPP